MINEFKKIFENIKNIKNLMINEGVSDSKIIDAINNHKIIHIYYNGSNTYFKGYRTIRPFVLGIDKRNGKRVLRAWQDAGSSDSFRKEAGDKPRWGHEKQHGPHGAQPGWRLFIVDDITSIMPTGEIFTPSKYFRSGDGVSYNPNDKDMSSITAAIPKGNEPIEYKPEKQIVRTYAPASNVTREIDKDELMNLVNIAKKLRKKALSYYWVVQTNQGDMVLKPESSLRDIPEKAVVGNLRDLYNKYIEPTIPKSTKFFDDEKNKTLNNLQKKGTL